MSSSQDERRRMERGDRVQRQAVHHGQLTVGTEGLLLSYRSRETLQHQVTHYYGGLWNKWRVLRTGSGEEQVAPDGLTFTKAEVLAGHLR